MERQFHDLDVLRTEIAKLRTEKNTSRRREWMRKGLFAADEQKGARRLIQRGPSAPPAVKPLGRYDLNVELESTGSVRVLPPLTNSPTATPLPTK